MKTQESSLTVNISTPMLRKLRDDFAAKAKLLEDHGEPDFAKVWHNLVRLAEEGLTARGATPGQNGDKG